MDKAPTLRVSTKEREAAVDRLQAAFLQGRLNDTELAERIDRALSARIGGDLDAVLGDLPVEIPQPRPAPQGGNVPTPLKFVVSHKGSTVQSGRWTVPTRFKALSYKSHQTLDLTKAVLTGARTEIRVTAYKSTVEIVVPAGVAVEVKGLSYAGSWHDETGGGNPDGPLVVVKGFAYKGAVHIKRGEK